MIYSANFGPTHAAASPGVTEYSAAGAVTVSRTTSGVAHIANGFFVRDFTPHASTAVLAWDVGTVFAYETLSTSSDTANIAAIKAKTDNLPASPAASGEYSEAIAAIPTAAQNRVEMDANSVGLAMIADVPTLAEIEASAVLAKEATVLEDHNRVWSHTLP